MRVLAPDAYASRGPAHNKGRRVGHVPATAQPEIASSIPNVSNAQNGEMTYSYIASGSSPTRPRRVQRAERTTQPPALPNSSELAHASRSSLAPEPESPVVEYSADAPPAMDADSDSDMPDVLSEGPSTSDITSNYVSQCSTRAVSASASSHQNGPRFQTLTQNPTSSSIPSSHHLVPSLPVSPSLDALDKAAPKLAFLAHSLTCVSLRTSKDHEIALKFRAELAALDSQLGRMIMAAQPAMNVGLDQPADTD